MKKSKISRISALLAAGTLLLGGMFMSCSLGDDDDDGDGSQPEQEKNYDTGSTVSDYSAPAITGNLYPAQDSTDAFVDTDLYVVYDANIEIDRASTAKISISDGTNTDEIAVAGEKYEIMANKQVQAVNVNKELVMASGKTLVIKPHSILKAGIKYTVTVPAGIVKNQAEKTWSFTPKAVNTPSNSTITVGTDCASINGALHYLMDNNATGDWIINVPAGNYHEILGYYQSSDPVNLTIVGAESEYGKDTKVFWNNSQALGNSQRTRQLFIWEGNNLTIKNMTFRNTASRKEEGNVNIQAETLYFDCKADLVVYNSTFSSYQDTLLLGNNGGRAWFYKDYIEGDVDFIWGYANVALFENCKIVCLSDGIKNDAKIFASRAPYGTLTSKGFVLMDSDVVIQNGCKAAYGRSSGADTQAAVFNNTFTTEGSGSLASALWGSASDTTCYEANGEMAVGYKDYNNTLNGSVVDTSKRLEKTADMSERLYKREYNGRYTILNRSFNTETLAYETNSSVWDISNYEKEFDAPQDVSKENIYVEPVFAKNVVGGTTVQLASSTTSAENLTYTYSSSDEKIATVDANGLVTAVTGATGSAEITLTASNGNKDVSTIEVIPVKIDVSSISLEAPSSVDIYGLKTATVTFEPADATVRTLTWTATGDIKLVDPSTKTAVATLETTGNTVQFEGLSAGGSGTIKAVSVDNPFAKAEKLVSVTTKRDYNADEAVAVNSNDENAGFGILNFQNGKVGMWHDLYVHAIYESTNGKITASGERVQSRYGTIYIPVSASSVIDVTCQKFSDDSPWVTDFTDHAGNAPEKCEDENEATYKYHYKWELDYTNDTAKLVDGSDVKALYDKSAKDASRSWSGHEPDANSKYFAIVIPGKDRYWTHITVTEDSSIHHEAATATLSINEFANANVTLDLNGTTAETQITSAESSDGTAPNVAYSSDSDSIVSVDSSTGAITAKAIGVAKITATASHASDENVAKATASYTVLVKDTSVEDSYKINLPSVTGATDSTQSYDFGKFSTTNSYYHDGTHGWAIGAGGTITVHVTGASTITLGCCKWGDHTENGISVSADSSTFTLATGEGAAVEYSYTGTEAADITFTNNGKEVYLHSISVEKAGESKVIDTDTEISFGTDGNYSGLTKLDVSNAKIRDNGKDNTQISSGSISFDVLKGAAVTVASFPGYTSYTLSDGTTTSATQTGTSYSYTATADCTITIAATDSNNYLYSITISY